MSEIFFFLIFSLFIIFFLFIINFLLSPKKYITLKGSNYECGFEGFSDFKESYDLRYFIIGILFLIFDIEIIFLIPISVNLLFLGFFGF